MDTIAMNEINHPHDNLACFQRDAKLEDIYKQAKNLTDFTKIWGNPTPVEIDALAKAVHAYDEWLGIKESKNV